MNAGIPHSELAARLIIEGCIANVSGSVQGKMPVAPMVLSELERADIGLKQGGQTLFYPLPPSGVFMDMDGPLASVWYMQADADRGLAVLEARLKQTHPRAKQLKDQAHVSDARLRTRSYEIEFSNRRVALVEIDYPAPGGPASQFGARVLAQSRR